MALARFVILFVLVSGTIVSAAHGQLSQKQKLLVNPAVGSTGFGNCVAVEGDTMVVGASGYDTTPTTEINRGAAYVFVRSGGTWTQQARLLANDGAAGDEFGYSVAISGETVIVGAWRSNAPTSNSGAAYVFVRSGTAWTQQQKLVAADGAVDDEFGNSVAIGGNTVAVGSHSADQPSGGGHAGAVYIFDRSGTTWSQMQKLIPTGQVLFGDFLGESVAISGDTLVAGASGDQEPTRMNRGAVYVYIRAGVTWTQQAKLEVPDSQPSTELGSSVAIDGDTIVSGALGDTPNVSEPHHGAAYVFVRDGGNWSAQQRLTASDGAMSDYFGWSVAVRDDALIVGARHDDTAAGVDAGSAYFFARNGSGWTQKQKLASSDGAAGDILGTSASLESNGTLVIGAPGKNLPAGQGNGAGAAYVFQISKTTLFDFDGDFKSDISIFRPASGQWWISNSGDNNVMAATFGLSSDRPTPGDFTGDGKTDIAFWRPSTGEWFILRSEDSSFFSYPFGAAGDIPQVGDFDADGKADSAVFRPSQATWFILRSSGGVSILNFGSASDKPVARDYDGDGKADVAIFRPTGEAGAEWWILKSSDSSVFATTFGDSNDKAVPGDYTGDGKADIAFFRPATGNWYILRSEDQSFYAFPFGISSDIPAPGDFDGDAKFDAAVFRPSSATWFVSKTTGGVLIQQFGVNGDLPLPNAFVP